jgi:Ca-activated chloride channel homolog
MFRTHILARTLAPIALLLAFAASSAQDAAPDKPTKAETPLVRLNVMITDKKGRTVSDVKAEDLRLFVDGMEQPIAYFSKEEQPVSYGLVVDNSGSLRDQIQYVVVSAKVVVDSNAVEDESFVVRFVASDNIRMMQGMTSDKAALFKALEAMYVEGGQTAVVDALYLAADHLLKNGKPAGDKPRRHALVLISDGEDRASFYKTEDIFKLIRRSDVQIFCIGLTAGLNKQNGFVSSSSREKARDFLKRLADETGGRVFFAEKIGELKDAINEIINNLHTQYVVGFVPATAAGVKTNHKIEIRVVDAPGREKLKAVFRPEYAGAGQTGAEVQKK